MLKRFGILSLVLAAATMFHPATASAQDFHRDGGRHDGHGPYARQEYNEHFRHEDRGWNDRGRDHQRYERSYRGYDRPYYGGYYRAPVYGGYYQAPVYESYYPAYPAPGYYAPRSGFSLSIGIR